VKLAGLTMVASILWESRRREKGRGTTMRLVKAAALHFVDRIGGCSNPATFVASAWGCEQATKGSNINGKVTNTWLLPPWYLGASETIPIRLTRRQFERWNHRQEILRACSNRANPHAAIVSKTLALTGPGPAFDETERSLTAPGELNAVAAYRAQPDARNLTRDGDVQSNVSRLPSAMRAVLQIEGNPVAEFDVKSAHAVLLGIFYEDESGEDWMAERVKFADEARLGFPLIYGERKEWKIDFLSALNQQTYIARRASKGYREFERLFPLLAGKIARLKRVGKKTVGQRLRCELAEIMKQLIIDNDKDGIHTIPVVDSAVVATPTDAFARHRAEFRTAWRLAVPMSERVGVSPTIVGSDGAKFQFLF
jgi:hypothetical protein